MSQLAFSLEDRPFLARIRQRLLAEYGPAPKKTRLDPVSQLIKSMVSSRTPDAISAAAFERLQRRFSSWDLLLKASPGDVQTIIEPVKFADSKAMQLLQSLRLIRASYGSLNLSFMADLEEDHAMHLLQMLPGVGPKIAAAVLNFSSLRKRALSVDTHLLRIGKRLALLPPDADYETGHDLYMRFIPADWADEELYELHWLLKRHGQQICSHQAPKCGDCPLRDLCQDGMKRTHLAVG
jgi:endonuclease-3